MSWLNKALCPPQSHYQGINRWDGLLALGVTILYGIYLSVDQHNILQDEYVVFRRTAVSLAWIIAVIAIVAIRGQTVLTLGFSGNILPYVALIASCAVVGMHSGRTEQYLLTGRWVFYLIAVAGWEEVLMRGFLQTRMEKLMGNRWAALLIAGGLFGAFHRFLPMIWNGHSLHGALSGVGVGIAVHVILFWVYARTGNIVNAILLHACLDFTLYMPQLMPLCLLYTAAVLYIGRRKLSDLFPGVAGAKMVKTTISRAEPGDLAGILELQRLACRGMGGDELHRLQRAANGLEQEYLDGIILKAADENGKIIGSVCGHAIGNTLHIGQLAVHPKFQGMGISTALLEEIERACPKERYELLTGGNSTRSIRLYEQMGYAVFDKRKTGNGFQMVYLEKRPALRIAPGLPRERGAKEG